MGEAKRRSTQYSVLVSQYTQYSVVGAQYSILRSIVWQLCCAWSLVVAAAVCSFLVVIGSSWAKHRGSHHAYRANKVDTKEIMRQVNLHRAAHREQTANLTSFAELS